MLTFILFNVSVDVAEISRNVFSVFRRKYWVVLSIPNSTAFTSNSTAWIYGFFASLETFAAIPPPLFANPIRSLSILFAVFLAVAMFVMPRLLSCFCNLSFFLTSFDLLSSNRCFFSFALLRSSIFSSISLCFLRRSDFFLVLDSSSSKSRIALFSSSMESAHSSICLS